MTRVDAHQHFWNPARGDYGWMPPDDPVLTRRYGPADLDAQRAAAGIGATVLVQAAPSLAETEYMLGIADVTPWVAGVVGWVDFETPAALSEMERLAAHPKLKGLRPMIQDIADVDWMLGDGIDWAYRALTALGLRFDALGFPCHLPNFLTLFQRHPDMRVVVDHCMKPQIRDHSPERFRTWAEGIGRIARDTGAFCKLSGIVTESNADWTVDDLRPYVEHVLDVFGPARVMWGSDWPVCRLRGEYADWIGAAETLTQGLSPADRARVFGGTAIDFYGLELPDASEIAA